MNLKENQREAVRRGWRRLRRVAVSLSMWLLVTSAVAQKAPYDWVDPRIGTANEGQTYPVVGMPFAMTGWTPETRANEDKCIAPYYYGDKSITGFRGSHWMSGTCTQDYGSFTLMPTVGPVKVGPEERGSSFDHASEVMHPAYYAVTLDAYQARVEVTGTERTGMLRIQYPQAGEELNLLIEPNAKPGEGFVEVRPEHHQIVGFNPVHRMYQAWGKPAGFSGYFVMEFREEVASFGTWCGRQVSLGSREQGRGCERLGGFVSLHARGPVVVKIGTSFTSLEEAEKNLAAENSGWDFDEVRSATEQAWRKRLGSIEVEGGTAAERTLFYTALFHSNLAPRIVSDADGTYNGFSQEGKLHRTEHGYVEYDDFSLWDTFRALHPLLVLTDPRREEQMVQSLVDKGAQGGFLPIFPTWNSYTQEMIGDHAGAVIYDAYAKGLRGFDVSTAYALMLKNATVVPPKDIYLAGKGRRALDVYERLGYIPLEEHVLDAFHHDEQVSRTLEYAYDDFVASAFAHALGHERDAAALRKRSGNWRNVIDSTTGFARGRHADGSWIVPFDPAVKATYVTEANPWQYTFFVPQDMAALVALRGEAEFRGKLDGLFDRKLYEQGNEPSHHIAYLYNFTTQPWKTQQRVRDLLKQEFRPLPGGLPGNDDSGQMSAWYVFSAMGFYPICPGKTEYELSSPVFTRVAMHLENGKTFTIEAPGASDKQRYIESISLNGKRVNGYELQHMDILSGSTLHFSLGEKPK